MKKKRNRALSGQIHIYSLETGCFYTEKEERLHRAMARYMKHKAALKSASTDGYDDDTIQKYEALRTHVNRKIKSFKALLAEELVSDPGIVRTLPEDKLTDTRIISVFESALTRTAGMKAGELTTGIIVVQTYFYDVIRQLIVNGFYYKREKYIYFTSSAGQIRTKKTVFIKESLWKKIEKPLMCGLTVPAINERGGMNANKFLAYLALSNSATEPWTGFDIRRCIVVPDFETSVRCRVDFIHDDTYTIERKETDVPIPHTDGCGMILPRLSRKNFMVRLPWVKGLLASFDFVRFIREHGSSPVVTDIYGKRWDILADRIQIIFTESQFKMSRFYTSWEQYQTYFEDYGCQAGICNMEEDYVPDATLNYQMLQTLTDITEEEAAYLIRPSLHTLEKLSSDKKTILRVFGAVPGNPDKTWLQQALLLYPEMIADEYIRARLREIKKSLVKEYRSGKLEVSGKYTFIVPDLYAFCERLFLGIPEPEGLLADGEVSCRLYYAGKKVDCLRSPHLYREHAVRRNIKDEATARWFTTNALYTSTHDPISKILQFDVDGDRSLVVGDPVFVEIAERNMAMDDIVPLYYEMKKARPVPLSREVLYDGISAAYRGGNIGRYSNSISKIFNSVDWAHVTEEKKEEALLVIKLLCMENNFCIDMAKTQYMPDRPKETDALIRAYTKGRLPHFFLYAKDKTEDQVEPPGTGFVDRLEEQIRYRPIRLAGKNFGKFSYTKLMARPRIEIDGQVIEAYDRLNRKYHFRLNPGSADNVDYVIETVRKELLGLSYSETDICDMLVKHLYRKKTPHKELLWQCFGSVIVGNLKRNLPEGSIQCESCGIRFIPTSPNQKYCSGCGTYRPAGTKTIACIDCGCPVEVDAKDTKTCRCPVHRQEHQKKLRQEQNRRAYERRRQNQQASSSVL